MGYSKEVYNTVRAAFAERRQNAHIIAEKRKYQMYQDIPELEALEREQLLAGVAFSKAMLLPDANAEQLASQLQKTTERIQAARNEIFNACGIPHNYFEAPYACSKCRDYGYVNGILCDCMKDALKAEAYRCLNMLSPLMLSSFDNFKLNYYPDAPDSKIKVIPRNKMTEILNYCIRYADIFSSNSPNILMMGKTGLGKTHLSLAIAAKVIEKGFGVVYGSAQNLLRSVEVERFSKENISSALDSLLECDLLILDDLGAEFKTNFTYSAVYNIVNTRLLTGRPTIISTNLTTDELKNEYSEKVVSRIIGSYNNLRFFGNDIRDVLRKERQNT